MRDDIRPGIENVGAGLALVAQKGSEVLPEDRPNVFH